MLRTVSAFASGAIPGSRHSSSAAASNMAKLFFFIFVVSLKLG